MSHVTITQEASVETEVPYSPLQNRWQHFSKTSGV